ARPIVMRVSPAHEKACMSSRRIMPLLPTPPRLRAMPTLRPSQRDALAVPVAVPFRPRPAARAALPDSPSPGMAPIRPHTSHHMWHMSLPVRLRRSTPDGGRARRTARLAPVSSTALAANKAAGRPDATCAAAVDLAREGILDDHVGPHLGVVAEGERLVTHF